MIAFINTLSGEPKRRQHNPDLRKLYVFAPRDARGPAGAARGCQGTDKGAAKGERKQKTNFDTRSARQQCYFEQCVKTSEFLSRGSRPRSQFCGPPRQFVYMFKAFYVPRTEHYKTIVKVFSCSFVAYGPVSKSFFDHQHQKNDFEPRPWTKYNVW